MDQQITSTNQNVGTEVIEIHSCECGMCENEETESNCCGGNCCNEE